MMNCSACSNARDSRLQYLSDHYRATSARAFDNSAFSRRDWTFQLNFNDSDPYRDNYRRRTVSGSYTRDCHLCGQITVHETWELSGHIDHLNLHWFSPIAGAHIPSRSFSEWFPSLFASSPQPITRNETTSVIVTGPGGLGTYSVVRDGVYRDEPFFGPSRTYAVKREYREERGMDHRHFSMIDSYSNGNTRTWGDAPGPNADQIWMNNFGGRGW
ncbi:hypothetical protein BJ742DRAFT_740721 [Cladochytrium replicatum]|nr:hypothetical protein BJ742DRAFT_740721 [Cladochytrium replicatum]